MIRNAFIPPDQQRPGMRSMIPPDQQRPGFAPQFYRPGMGATSDATPSQTWMVLSTASMAAGIYHGYRRNNSIGWALAWGLLGAMFPVVVPAIAIAQGFGERKR